MFSTYLPAPKFIAKKLAFPLHYCINSNKRRYPKRHLIINGAFALELCSAEPSSFSVSLNGEDIIIKFQVESSMWENDEQVLEKEDLEIKEPSMYRVVLLNDDYTPMDFVVLILISIFHKNRKEAEQIMLNVHKQGKGICGVYTFEIAETKVKMVETLADSEKYPLRCVMEEA